MSTHNYLTIDVEDYFHVSAFKDVVALENWNDYTPRVEKNTHSILSIFNKHNVKGTFFILGWVAERYPNLIKEIAAEGHEIACHSFFHRLIYSLSPIEFKEDTKRTKGLLEDITNAKIKGYRAPSYSITRKSLWALKILYDLGFEYDSSIFPIYHDIYGIPDAPRFQFYWDLNNEIPSIRFDGEGIENKEKILREIPISTTSFLGKNIPISGGGYFRFFPYWFTKSALQKIKKEEKYPFMFYLHPWEIDPQQPKIKGAKLLSKFRHYNNLRKTENRLNNLLNDFTFGPISDTN